MDNIKKVMSTQLTESEVMVYFLVNRDKKTYREIAELPFGFTHETASQKYKSAAKKVEKLVKAGVLPPDMGREQH